MDDDIMERPWDLVLAFPLWEADSPSRHRLAELVARTLDAQLANWPVLDGADLQQRYAQNLAGAVRDALRNGGNGNDGTPLLDHLDALAHLLAGHDPDLDRYREQIEYLSGHLRNGVDRHRATTLGT
ncbi:hypothetical protein AB0A73_21585 [Glycomyces sp. NPDC047369]